ncbi:MAG: phosphoribosylanthranilate isomerase [Anaerolineaceae bacterium]|jgi:phosphoribosylanthranilate isomerase|nr:phosphoribosylanthranilate isomerase [Anaerolineaceae bacterium]
MIVQIYTVQSPAEGLALASLGVDHIGITPSDHGLPGEISNAYAAEIFAAIGEKAVKVALTVDSDLLKIVDMVKTVKPDILHLCGDLKLVTPKKVVELRGLLPGMQIMQAIPVMDETALQIARDYEEVSDYFILDSYSDQIGGIGAAGFTHDWSISRAIVDQSQIPVILAGGLSPDNVADAIQQVQPWGVDSLTRTNLPLGDGKFRKDLELVKLFVERAKNFM